MSTVIDSVELYANEETPAIKGEGLESLLTSYIGIENMIKKNENDYPSLILNEMLNVEPIDVEALKTRENLENWSENLLKSANRSLQAYEKFSFEVQYDEAESIYLPLFKRIVNGMEESYLIDKIFFDSKDYKKLSKLSVTISGLFSEDSYLLKGENKTPCGNFIELMEWIRKEGSKGVSIQRYKGLGEMNPEQLWETTMNPETRTLLKVRVEDIVQADSIFTTLMGDQVDPRRDFIEQNALHVANLDV